MAGATSENLEQQKTELETLHSIYYDKITVIKEEQEYMVEVTPILDEPVQLVFPSTTPCAQKPDASTASNPEAPCSTVSHLSPLVLYVRYHSHYPSERAPDFHVSARWLDSKALFVISDKLQQCFIAENLVVFDWISWLQDDFVREYSVQQAMDWQTHDRTALRPKSPTLPKVVVATPSSPPLSRECKVELDSVQTTAGIDEDRSGRHPCQIFLRSSSQLNDLEEFDRFECHKEFLECNHDCGVCFVAYPGTEFCYPCKVCQQLFCKGCMLQYCQVRISERLVNPLSCPYHGCSGVLTDPELQDLLPAPLFEKYIRLRNDMQLDSIPGMVFCPLQFCRSRIASEPGENLAMCSVCGFAFCKLCQQTWHGVEPCLALQKLSLKAEAAITADKTLMTSEKSKKQAEQEKRRVEELQSLVWMRSGENAKTCPKCSTMIQKGGGCNKMTCRLCGAQFCWLCGKSIAGYSHFDRGTCLLFRDKDYNPPVETTSVTNAPGDVETLENILMSKCPRCTQVETKTTSNNWIHCRKCDFQYCHLCREPCYGQWHFNKYGCKQMSTLTEDIKFFRHQ